MAFIIIGLMICVFSMGMLNTDLYIWGWAGIALGGLLILRGRRNTGLVQNTDKDKESKP